MGSAYTAEALYGAPPVVQATPSAIPDHVAMGHPEPNRQVAARTPGVGNPTVVLLALVVAVILLVQVSVRGSFELGA